MPVFLVAYLVGPLFRIRAAPITRVLLKRRRQWGLGFALAHSIHLAALLVNITLYRPRPFTALIGGILVYGLIYVMALTSNDAAMKRLGKWWKRIHRLGIHVIWFVFLGGYALRAVHEDPAYHLEGRLLLPVMLAALGIRIYAWRRKSRTSINP